MTIAQSNEVTPRFPFAAALARKDRAIVGPIADALLMYGSPLVALALIGSLSNVMDGTTSTALSFLVMAITFAHLLPVFVRSHFNPQIFAAHRLKLTIVPLVLLGLLVTSHWVFVAAGVVAIFWDVYHSAQQNFGLARIYDSKNGAKSSTGRLLDRMICHTMYIGPLMTGPSFWFHIDTLGNLNAIGLAAFSAVPQAAQGHAADIRLAGIALIVASIVVYGVGQWRLARAGEPVSAHKVALLAASTLVQMLAWGFFAPGIALMIINLYHAVQYFALVWVQEGKRIPERLGVKSQDLARPIALGVIIVIPVLYGLFEAVSNINSAGETQWNFLAGVYLTVSLLHFWMDGFIRSVRKKTL